MNNIIVSGGAGYVGSHACKALFKAGFTPIVYDNLSTGWADAVKYGPLFEGDLLDKDALQHCFEQYQPIAVMHFAALSLVGESMQKPQKYWHENVNGALNLISQAIESGCKKFVFSSTCATYGDHDNVLLNEKTPLLPTNSYAASKIAIEQMLANFEAAYDLDYVIFRYFNVAGADPNGELGEQHQPETHLIPLIFQTIDGQRDTFCLYGDDYPTPDGTCIRDYVHVDDLAQAHVLGLQHILNGNSSSIFNLGTGRGFSVKDVINTAEHVTGEKVPVRYGPRRAGDCAKLVSGSDKANKILGWTPKQSTLEQMISDAWNWHRNGKFHK